MEEFAMSCALVVVTLVTLLLVGAVLDGQEISESQYDSLKEWQAEFPELKEKIEDALNDGEVSKIEFRRIERYREGIEKKKEILTD